MRRACLLVALWMCTAGAGRADLHVHLTMADALPFFSGEVDGSTLASHPDQWLRNQVRTAHLDRAGISLVVAALWPPWGFRPGRTRFDEALASAEGLGRFTRTRPGYAVASDSAQARRLIARDLVAVVPHLEGTQGVRSVQDVDALYAAGYRALGLVHFADNSLAEAREGQFGPVSDWLRHKRPGGLTALGREAVQRMISLGMIIDLGHASRATRQDVLALAEAAGVPVMFSHAGSEWQVARTLDDEHARRIARGGGLIGIGVFRHDVLMPIPEASRLPGHVLDTCDDVVAHWRHYAHVAGADAVMLGSDLNSTIHRPRAGGSCPRGIRNAGDLPALFAALQAHGIPQASLDGSAERFLQFWERVEAAASPAARAEAMTRRAQVPAPLDAPL
jgi:membrane dipeptidase